LVASLRYPIFPFTFQILTAILFRYIAMASAEKALTFDKISTNSQDTALCIIPPNMDCGDIDRLRELYDKGYGKWPAHINLIYPFVTPESLPQAQHQIQSYFDRNLDSSEPHTVELSDAGLFKHRNNSTAFIQESQSQLTSSMTALRSMALQALGQKSAPSNLHLTIGQSQDNTLFQQQFLLRKAQLLPTLNFRIGALAILVRERTSSSDTATQMKLWGIINIAQPEDVWRPTKPEHWINQTIPSFSILKSEGTDGNEPASTNTMTMNRGIQSGSTYYYNSQQNVWSLCQNGEENLRDTQLVTISSYNVLIDSEYPPTRDRDAFLLETILSEAATSDILVLQEVSDDFLSYVLGDPEVQIRYPFTSHGPPSQPDIGPLSSMRNIVMLSRWYFSWYLLPFHRKHKGALIAEFGPITQSASTGLIVAGVHLTAGLTDSSVTAKKTQLQTLTTHLTQEYAADSWIIAGDFNLVTSTHTINNALKENLITEETVDALSSIEAAFADVGLVDTWVVAHVEAADEIVPSTYEELFEGEEGATFDPRNNILAAATSETSSGRPQRYDRVLVRSQDLLQISRCNIFGLPEDKDGAQVVASDHSGIRSTLEISKASMVNDAQSQEVMQWAKVKHMRAVGELTSALDLSSILEAGGMFPTEEDAQQRQKALALLKQVIIGTSDDDDDSGMPDIPMVVVPVGSYALGAWTAESDIDCLCIGTISSKTFFRLARQRLAKASDQGVRILRKVEASTGTMLELSVNGVAMDLQYCPAASVVER
jgi:endonuclease/exonuclease/phosphatase family metal-dependent hydrolase/2'-5' RNA ligase